MLKKKGTKRGVGTPPPPPHPPPNPPPPPPPKKNKKKCNSLSDISGKTYRLITKQFNLQVVGLSFSYLHLSGSEHIQFGHLREKQLFNPHCPS